MLLQRKEAEYFSNYLLKICFRTFRTAFISVLSLAIQNFLVILEDFYNLFIYKRFEGKDKIEVTNWQPCLFLRFSVSCYQCRSS